MSLVKMRLSWLLLCATIACHSEGDKPVPKAVTQQEPDPDPEPEPALPPAAVSGSAGAPAANNRDEPDLESICGEGGWTGRASDAGVKRMTGYGSTHLSIPTNNEIVRLRTTLIVPPTPVANGTVFLWPGLQPLPRGKRYAPIGNGVLQPVLTWGATCARGAPNDHASWWISGQYVNVSGDREQHRGCLGGEGMTVDVGDRLLIDMRREGSVWTQDIYDARSGKRVRYAIDMQGQAQNWAIFHIELPTRTKPAGDAVFANTVISLAAPSADACQPYARGTNDFFSTPRASPDGLQCCFERIVLRAEGVPPSTPN